MSVQRLGRLDVGLEPVPGGARVTLAGRIDDASPLGELVAAIPAGDVVIDTSGVAFVNSVGMREWIRLVRVLRDRGLVTLERVSDVLMKQMNLIPELHTSVRVLSFHAQYVCNSCGAEAAPVVDAVEHAAGLARMQAPNMSCPECGTAMELGDFPERYLLMFRA
ncbi:MAG: hypothetical protein KF773_14780 [Deltaproteobacteria bacterium]|nr:hypothetical protein [Deltaproteobacteria bacterium]MCW5807873.1 hypothetical protein [Deltaproteobacteria bacterium]